MIGPRARAVVALVLAVVAGFGCAASWSHVRVQVLVAPILVGEPDTISVNYDPHWLLLTLLTATIAGLLAISGVAGIWHARQNM